MIAACWFPGSFPCNFHGPYFYSLVIKFTVKAICLVQVIKRPPLQLVSAPSKFNLRGTIRKLCSVVLLQVKVTGMKDFWNESYRWHRNSPCACSLIGMIFMASLSASWHQSREEPWRIPRGLYRIFLFFLTLRERVFMRNFLNVNLMLYFLVHFLTHVL